LSDFFNFDHRPWLPPSPKNKTFALDLNPNYWVDINIFVVFPLRTVTARH